MGRCVLSGPHHSRGLQVVRRTLVMTAHKDDRVTYTISKEKTICVDSPQVSW